MKLFALVMLACGTPCPKNPPAFADLQPFLSRSCYKCHAASVRGANRQGSPPDANYDSEDALAARLQQVISRSTTGGTLHMPPASSTLPDLSTSETQALRDWGACR